MTDWFTACRNSGNSARFRRSFITSSPRISPGFAASTLQTTYGQVCGSGVNGPGNPKAHFQYLLGPVLGVPVGLWAIRSEHHFGGYFPVAGQPTGTLESVSQTLDSRLGDLSLGDAWYQSRLRVAYCDSGVARKPFFALIFHLTPKACEVEYAN
jgi:hypothetical protein